MASHSGPVTLDQASDGLPLDHALSESELRPGNMARLQSSDPPYD